MSEFIKRIEDWLQKEGYPLEMMVAREFRSAGFRVIQSDYYVDPTSETSREIDVTANVDREGKAFDHAVRAKFVIECKSGKEKPWLLLCSSGRGLANPARIAQRCASELGRRVLYQMARIPSVQAMPLFKISIPPAYGMIQGLRTNNDDVAYKALSSVAAAAAAAGTSADKPRTITRSACCIVFPVIVIEAPLFTCLLAEGSKLKLVEVDRGTVLWRNPVVGMPHTIVDVVTANAVAEFASDRFKAATDFVTAVTTELLDAVTTKDGLPDRIRKFL